MKSSQQWFVRVERQPHRDAVRRLRQVYGRLWEMQRSTSTARPDHKRVPNLVQEVQE